MATQADHSFSLGEHWLVEVACHQDPDGLEPLDLDGGSVGLRIWRGSTLILEKAGTIAVPDGGTVMHLGQITVSPDDQDAAADLRRGAYNYDIRAVTAAGLKSDQAFGTIIVRRTGYSAA